MPNLNLDELERLAAQATPGPWYPAKNHTAYDGYGNSVFTTEQTHNLDNNLAYITAACNAVPELIAENRALRELEIHKRTLACRLSKAVLHPVQEEMSNFRLHKREAEELLSAVTDRTPPLCIRALQIIIELCDAGLKLEAENADLKRELLRAGEKY